MLACSADKQSWTYCRSNLSISEAMAVFFAWAMRTCLLSSERPCDLNDSTRLWEDAREGWVGRV
jgi:hypothetical protein